MKNLLATALKVVFLIICGAVIFDRTQQEKKKLQKQLRLQREKALFADPDNPRHEHELPPLPEKRKD